MTTPIEPIPDERAAFAKQLMETFYGFSVDWEEARFSRADWLRVADAALAARTQPLPPADEPTAVAALRAIKGYLDTIKGGADFEMTVASLMCDADCYAQTAVEYSRGAAKDERSALEYNLRSALASRESPALTALAERVQQAHEWGYRGLVGDGFIADNSPFDLANAVLASTPPPEQAGTPGQSETLTDEWLDAFALEILQLPDEDRRDRLRALQSSTGTAGPGDVHLTDEHWTDAKLRGIASDYCPDALEWPRAMLCMRHLLMELRALQSSTGTATHKETK